MHECKQSEMALALACADTYTLASHRYDVNEIWVFSVRSPALGGCVCIHNIDVRSVRTVVATLAFAFTMVSFEWWRQKHHMHRIQNDTHFNPKRTLRYVHEQDGRRVKMAHENQQQRQQCAGQNVSERNGILFLWRASGGACVVWEMCMTWCMDNCVCAHDERQRQRQRYVRETRSSWACVM